MNKKINFMTQKNNGLSLIETLLAIFILGSVLTVLVVNLNKSLLILIETKYRAYASELGQNCMDEIGFDNSSTSWSKFENETIGSLKNDDSEICYKPNDPEKGAWKIIESEVAPLSNGLFFVFQQANPDGFETDNVNCKYNPPFLTVLHTNDVSPKNVVSGDIYGSSICAESSKEILRNFELDENGDDLSDMNFEVKTQICFSTDKIKILQTGDNKCSVALGKTLDKKIAAVRTTVSWSKTIGAATQNQIEFQRFFVGN